MIEQNVEKLLAGMRLDMRRVVPALRAEGWQEADIVEVSALVKSHVASGDLQALGAVAAWLAARRWRQLSREIEQYQADRLAEISVTHDEAALQAFNRTWRRTVVFGRKA